MKQDPNLTPLPDAFYQYPTLQLAEELLGCILVKQTEEGTSAGYIVETEAYLGNADRAAHGFGNRRTKRTEILYAEAGMTYTHLIHNHCLINVVSAEKEVPESVLIRAVEPYTGIDLMMARRPVKKFQNLTSGPGKLSQALDINMRDYGRSLKEPPLFIAEGKKPEKINRGPRIGIDNSGEARDYPYRFWVAGNKFVSK
ncbi:putative 3-methyladenine DNA glycosylase [Oceanobacillus oncorhynchi subsp. incaldanensis]|uniref:Putative 3-methyladenine DNA glycosylase n=2 Tax=Oceanobacillus TaxID=182709 RepID=A0A0A1M9H0_9BACI|nr:DNA-3-methyladenine glycosylase [Oceanobacillus oncorhynchi]MDM8100008.1 DNA-3-methyladenine glycosylase [Oceanobacillus oncorhynchi]UUI40557.1 DNA-3-methyladenine glycosylase [Oceanobacillus oncorhynchi]GIO18505.1 putative 3-methyladenine DNA glycosylase [Oceanobacillus oncorhynchi subsp. incaldanensis]CEI81985.1 Putative 3-methyladenine DNA glycosylase [Oceanobacillus oncorhynchi]